MSSSTTLTSPKTTLPKGSLILITGITGFVASHVARQLLQRGYRVRGTVRSLAAATWVTAKDGTFGPHTDKMELVEVPDLGADHAFDKAIKGVDGVVHPATISSFSGVPDEVIPQTVTGVTALLELAANEPSVKAFVYTSSCVAQIPLGAGAETHVTRDTWNDKAVEVVYNALDTLPEGPVRGTVVYQASKTRAERAMWKFVADRKPHFVVNSVNPTGIIGEPLIKKHAETPYAWISHAYRGDKQTMLGLGTTPQFIDVKDQALLHVAALLDPDVKNARLSAWGPAGQGWNEVLDALRRLRPHNAAVQGLEVEIPDGAGFSTVDVAQEFALLRKWGAQDGWTPLARSVDECLKYFE